MAQRSRDGVVSGAFLSRLRIGFTRLPHEAEKSESVPARARNLKCDVAERRVLAVLISKPLGQHFYQDGSPLPAAPEHSTGHGKALIMLLFTLMPENHRNGIAAYAKETLWCDDPQVGIVGDLTRPCARTLGKLSFCQSLQAPDYLPKQMLAMPRSRLFLKQFPIPFLQASYTCSAQIVHFGHDRFVHVVPLLGCQPQSHGRSFTPDKQVQFHLHISLAFMRHWSDE